MSSNVRKFDFVSGVETSALPAAGTPTEDDDTITLGYADDHYVQGGAAVADPTALQAIAAADRADNDVIFVDSEKSFYFFDAASSASDVGDAGFVIVPSAGTGRWIKVTPFDTTNGNLDVIGDLTVQGTTTTINTATLDVEDANITVNNGGTQSTANTNKAGLTVEMSDATDATIGYDSTLTSKFKAGEVGSESELITAAGDQVMTGIKSFDASVSLKEISTPANPASGYKKIYPKADGKLYTLDDAGNELEVGSGGGAGGINQVTNPNAETDTSDWTTYADVAGATPVDGTGGSPTLTFTRNTTTPLRDSADFLFTKDAADRQGEGVSTPLDFDSADTNKVLSLSFDYDGTLDSDYASDDIKVFIYDITNAQLITPSGDNGLKAAKTTFQTTWVSTDSTSYRLVFHVASTNAAAYTLSMVNVRSGPQEIAFGVPRSDEKSYTPAITDIAGIKSGVWSRDGDRIYIRGRADVTGAFTGVLHFEEALPTGTTVDTTNILSGEVVGSVFALDTGTARHIGVIHYDGTNFTAISEAGVNWNATAPHTWASGDLIGWELTLPISQWAGSSVWLSTAKADYQSNTDTATGADDTTDFVSGPSGQSIVSISSANAWVKKRIRRSTSSQPTDVNDFYVTPGNNKWFRASSVFPPIDTGTAKYGMRPFDVANGTDIDIGFGGDGATENEAWSTYTSWKWYFGAHPGVIQSALPSAIKWQEKTLSADVSTDNTDLLEFTGLTSGKTYRYSGNVCLLKHSTDLSIQILIKEGTTEVKEIVSHESSVETISSHAFDHIFVATETTIKLHTQSLSAGTLVKNTNATHKATWAKLEELPYHIETSEW